MAHKLFNNQDVLDQLRNGTAKFELVSSPVPSVAAAAAPPSPNNASLFEIGNCSSPFFARIASSFGGQSPAMKKLERFSVQKVTGDGRCLFRALVKGMAYNKGIALNQRQERENADELRMAVKEAICDSNGERKLYEEALIAITVDESLQRYCQRIVRPDFWGGESELLVLSKLCKQPIIVYIPEHEHRGSGGGSGFIPIAEYGREFMKGSRNRKPRKPVRLLYSDYRPSKLGSKEHQREPITLSSSTAVSQADVPYRSTMMSCPRNQQQQRATVQLRVRLRSSVKMQIGSVDNSKAERSYWGLDA